MSNEALNFATAEPFELMAIVADRFRRLYTIIGANIGRSGYIELYTQVVEWQHQIQFFQNTRKRPQLTLAPGWASNRQMLFHFFRNMQSFSARDEVSQEIEISNISFVDLFSQKCFPVTVTTARSLKRKALSEKKSY